MFTIFQIAFYTGILYAVVAFLLGEILHFTDLHGDLHTDGNIQSFTVSPLKPSTIATFVTTFGGVGMMLMKLNKGAVLAFGAAVGSGLIMACIIYFFVIIPLYKAQSTAIEDHEKLKGLEALVITPIFENGFGEISYTVKNNTFNAPAKHVGKSYLSVGEKVFIAYVEDNVFYVDSIKSDSLPHSYSGFDIKK
jgi:membrane-bound ClpP family serine protease